MLYLLITSRREFTVIKQSEQSLAGDTKVHSPNKVSTPLQDLQIPIEKKKKKER